MDRIIVYLQKENLWCQTAKSLKVSETIGWEGGIGGVNVVGNSLEALSNRLTMRRFICSECTEIVQCNATCGIYNRAQGGSSIALLVVSQYAVWAEQWGYQPPWELNQPLLALGSNFQLPPSLYQK